MTRPLFRTVRRRNPFAVDHLPFLAELYAAGFKPRRRLAKRFIGKPAKNLFRLVYRTGLGGTGRFTLALGDRTAACAFNARNTQYHALYLPPYAKGYEPDTTALFDILLPDDGVFFDIGANWGYYALFAAARPGFAGRIHAFEPMPATFADLASVVDQAGLGNVITCHQVALSAAPGQGTMTVGDGLHSGIARLGGSGGGGVEVPLMPLDDLDLPAPHVMKLDVEDHEDSVLTGARRLLARHRPYVAFESWREPHRPDRTLAPFTVLAEAGYLFFQTAWRRHGGGVDWIDAGDPPNGEEATLALVPLLPDQRFLLRDQMNVFACPAERLDQLAALFPD